MTYLKRLRVFKPASFRGKHNATKFKVLLFLSQHEDMGYTAYKLSSVLGFGKVNLASVLPKWEAWGYVESKTLTTRGSPKVWHIRKGGKEWLDRNYQYAPVERYLQEIKAYQARRDSIRHKEAAGLMT